MYNSLLTPKKMITAMIAAIFLILFVPWFLHYLTTGKIVVVTGNRYSDITISSVSKIVTNKGFSKHAVGSLTTDLKAGNYFVSVQQSSSGRSQYVTVNARKTKRLTMTIPATIGVEPVTYDNATALAADSSRLVYLDPVAHDVNQIDNDNQRTETGNNFQLTSIKWANTAYGVGQNVEGQLFTINNGNVHLLKSPASNQSSKDIVYAIGQNKKIYIGVGSSVYEGTETGGFQKIYTHRLSGSVLLAGNSKLAIMSSGYNGAKPNITILDGSRELVNKNYGGFLSDWSGWSQYDKYLLVIVGAKTEILDASLKQVATIPQSNITTPVWTNDNTVFYSVGSQLWSYDIKTQGDYLAANMPLSDTVRETTVSSDGSYIYLVTSDSSNNLAIRRVGLHNQRVSELAYKLQNILPSSGDGYDLRLINFSGTPTIVVEALDLENPQTALQSAIQYFQVRGFDTTNQLRFITEEDD